MWTLTSALKCQAWHCFSALRHQAWHLFSLRNRTCGKLDIYLFLSHKSQRIAPSTGTVIYSKSEGTVLMSEPPPTQSAVGFIQSEDCDSMHAYVYFQSRIQK